MASIQFYGHYDALFGETESVLRAVKWLKTIASVDLIALVVGDNENVAYVVFRSSNVGGFKFEGLGNYTWSEDANRFTEDGGDGSNDIDCGPEC